MSDDRDRDESRRPWGYYEVLFSGKEYKVKRIVLFPGKRLSLQKHRLRSEHWFIVEGSARVTRDGREHELSKGESIDIALGAEHRIENAGSGDLCFIEVQTGEYFGEDDIERLEDDFGRI